LNADGYECTDTSTIVDTYGHLRLISSQYPLTLPYPLSPVTQIVGPLIREENIVGNDEISQWLKGKENRVIYVSFGSDMSLTEKPMKELVTALTSIANNHNYYVLWARGFVFETYKVKVPERFRVEKYVPQQYLLKNGNISLYITHCGSNSILESLYFGVPLFGIPIARDQFGNCGKLNAELGKTITVYSLPI
jgi:UDP:flavonoid glycosyltransferase YjiC (YdhE family)